MTRFLMTNTRASSSKNLAVLFHWCLCGLFHWYSSFLRY